MHGHAKEKFVSFLAGMVHRSIGKYEMTRWHITRLTVVPELKDEGRLGEATCCLSGGHR
jgi:hypothetical protein